MNYFSPPTTSWDEIQTGDYVRLTNPYSGMTVETTIYRHGNDLLSPPYEMYGDQLTFTKADWEVEVIPRSGLYVIKGRDPLRGPFYRLDREGEWTTFGLDVAVSTVENPERDLPPDLVRLTPERVIPGAGS